ncbi:MAG: histidine phosphatase family protein [Spirochaetia bacterium]|jgi:phosphohistidine phosphatase|nr:histidine phosphatase family protein [Spirochaetia bacterium]
MKKILLLRHGNAASRTGNMADFERPLDNMGKKQISNIANKLAESGQIPDLIITSSALRAFSSAEIIQNNGIPVKITGTEILYSASIFEYMDILKAQKNKFESMLLVAHNPAISGFISRLSGKHIGMGTGNLCIIKLNIEKWSDLEFNSPVISTTFLKPQ